MSDRVRRVHAVAFNALSQALTDAGVFVKLSQREAITAAVVAAVRSEIYDQIAAHADGTPVWSAATLDAAAIARGES